MLEDRSSLLGGSVTEPVLSRGVMNQHQNGRTTDEGFLSHFLVAEAASEFSGKDFGSRRSDEGPFIPKCSGADCFSCDVELGKRFRSQLVCAL